MIRTGVIQGRGMGLTLLRSCEWEGAWHRFVVASGRGLALLRSCKWEGLGIASFLQVGAAWRCRRLRWLGPRARRVCARRCAWPHEWEVGAMRSKRRSPRAPWPLLPEAAAAPEPSHLQDRTTPTPSTPKNEANPDAPTTGAMRSKRRSPRAPLAPPTGGSGSARNLSLARHNQPRNLPPPRPKQTQTPPPPGPCAASGEARARPWPLLPEAAAAPEPSHLQDRTTPTQPFPSAPDESALLSSRHPHAQR